jgi:hypothetical protein
MALNLIYLLLKNFLEELNKERTKIEKSKKPSYTTAPVSLFQLFANLHVLHTVASSSSRVHDQVFITCERSNFSCTTTHSCIGKNFNSARIADILHSQKCYTVTTSFSINMPVLSKAIVEIGERIAKYEY